MISPHRFERRNTPTVQNWKRPSGPAAEGLAKNAVAEVGWGRLIFAHTFADNAAIAETLCAERPDQRDIALYLRDPHVVISLSPQDLFLDPSHTFRLWLDRYQPSARPPKGFIVRRMLSERDADAINAIYAKRHMVGVDPAFLWDNRESKVVNYVVAEDPNSGQIIGTALGVDHRQCFDDPENGSSLWCLAVDPQAAQPGVGEALVRHLAERFIARGRNFMDLSVMHDNTQLPPVSW